MLALIFVAWFLLWIVVSCPWQMDVKARQVLFALILIVLVILIIVGPYDPRFDLGPRLR